MAPKNETPSPPVEMESQPGLAVIPHEAGEAEEQVQEQVQEVAEQVAELAAALPVAHEEVPWWVNSILNEEYIKWKECESEWWFS